MENAVYINNLHAVLPNEAVSNKEMEVVLGEVGGQRSRAKPVILRSNQIKNRYYAIDPQTGEYNYTNASLAADAVRGLFSIDGTRLEQLDCLVASTSMADQIMPNHGVMVHGELKNPSLEVVSTAGICLCGMTALKYAYLNVKAGESQHSAVVASELASNVMHSRNFSAESDYKVDMLDQKPEIAFEKDFLRWMLSDGAGAALLSNQANPTGLSLRIDWIDIISYADQLEACMYAGAEKIDGQLKSWTRYDSKEREQQSILSVKQDVKLLNENIVKYTVEDALSKIAKKRALTATDYDFFLPHYSSGYFRERLFDGLSNIDFQIPFEKWFTNLTEKGNTGSASIFIMLDELFKSGRLTDGQKLLCYVPESGRFSSAFMQLTVVSR
ncbi:beta-ketoacyl-ACP synthase III [Pseudoalteromonas sp. NEC-BIFX-2020_002]|uniref:3-oxoacyl-ACP synthase n=1 Tax=Pseudoalteromonas porphyrae TaxID=187330 RepID=A0A0N1MVD6_9GAMM|nr:MULTISPECIES: beta-ketoacyl-ACP synthase III [Pseudoalteromonas]KPH62532.1 3-oxoacyl-ACP synthase [Pseudoalteromonas porphyrae]NNG41406.1 beta-ketoacyl-ACP synthase III [Pseudoalteromonas sp. NEC-BIFX-2020_002]